MDFIKIFGLTLEISSYVDITYLILAVVPLCIYVAFLLLEGIGLYTMAGKQGLQHRWRAFVPFANSYLMGQLTGNCPFCGKVIKNIKIWLLISELLCFLGGAVYYASRLIVSSSLYDGYRQIVTETWMGTEYYSYVYTGLSGWYLIGYNVYNISYYIFSLLEILYMIFYIITLVNFFRKYFAKSYMILVVGCIFLPIQGLCTFAVRNNKPVDYQDYLRRRRAQYYRGGPGYGGQNPYGYYNPTYTPPRNNSSSGQGGYNYDPYTGQPLHQQGSSSPKEEDPFPEFGGNDNGNNSNNNSSSNNASSNSGDDPFGL